MPLCAMGRTRPAGGSFREEEDDLAIAHPAELVAGDAFHRAAVVPKRLDLLAEREDALPEGVVALFHPVQLVAEGAVSRETPIVEDQERHRDHHPHEEREGQEPRRGRLGRVHRRDASQRSGIKASFPRSHPLTGPPRRHEAVPVSTTRSDRRLQILLALVEEHVATGAPVGSKVLANRAELDVSAATVRNELAELEDEGLLQKPHTSAGRVPTERGFRAFVDTMAEDVRIPRAARVRLRRMLDRLSPEQDALRATSQLVSELTGGATLVLRSRSEDLPIESLRFVDVRDDAVLAVLVTRGGEVTSRLVHAEAEDLPGARALERINRLLEALAPGRTLRALRDLERAERDALEGVAKALRDHLDSLIDGTLAAAPERPALLIEGRDRLFDQPEFDDTALIRAFLRAFDERARLVALLERTLDARGLHVAIGAEAGLAPIDDISIVSAPLRGGGGGEVAGSFAVIGPQRVDYRRVMPIVAYASASLSRVLS